MQGTKIFQEKLFNNFQLSRRIPEDNFYRRLSEVLDLEFLRKKTKMYYGNSGQKSIGPVVFFKLCLIGSPENINTIGAKQAHKCMPLSATAYNLKKYLKFMEKHGKSGAASLRFVFYRFKAAIEAILSPYDHLEIRP